jgi:hypothetical protein
MVVTLIDMMTNPLGAYDGRVACLIRGGNYQGGQALGTCRRAFSPRSLGPCDIYLEGWTLDLEGLLG